MEELFIFISRHSDEIGVLQQKLNLVLDLCRHVMPSAYRDPDDVFMLGMKKDLKTRKVDIGIGQTI
jgi:hypothetical protein